MPNISDRIVLVAMLVFGNDYPIDAADLFIDPMFEVQVQQDIVFGSGSTGNPADGEISLVLDLYTPVGVDFTTPGMILLYGGGFVERHLDQMKPLAEEFASRGWSVATADYRIQPDNPTVEPGPAGTAPQDPLIRAMHAAFNDAAKALDWMKDNAGQLRVDSERIVIGGGSSGAITSLFEGFRNNSAAAIFSMSGGMYGFENLIDSGDPPVALIHGTADTVVPYSLSQAVVQRAESVGVPYAFLSLDGVGHEEYFKDPLLGPQVLTFINDFLYDHLNLSDIGSVVVNLRAGDADQDLDFDQIDLVQVQTAAKYLTGESATWGQGDWNAAPGGSQGNPPAGDGLFNQLDVVAAQQAAIYLTGPYAAVAEHPSGDGHATLVYNPASGELAVQVGQAELTSINIDSAASIFTGDAAMNLGGSFDNDSDNNIFKATFGSSFGSLSFGSVAQPGLAKDFVLNDLTVIGSLAGGGDLGNVDLIYVPEPSSVLLVAIGVMALAVRATRRTTAFARKSTGRVPFLPSNRQGSIHSDVAKTTKRSNSRSLLRLRAAREHSETTVQFAENRIAVV